MADDLIAPAKVVDQDGIPSQTSMASVNVDDRRCLRLMMLQIVWSTGCRGCNQ
jgi:hypothetical protein